METMPWLVKSPQAGRALPSLWALSPGWAAAWKPALAQKRTRQCSRPGGGKAPAGEQAVFTGLLANHLFGTWNAIFHKYYVLKSDKVPMVAHRADLTHYSTELFARKKSRTLFSKDSSGTKCKEVC